jgi:hypothetical protein
MLMIVLKVLFNVKLQNHSFGKEIEDRQTSQLVSSKKHPVKGTQFGPHCQGPCWRNLVTLLDTPSYLPAC